MLRKIDIETDPDFAYEWAMRGIEFERQRILSLIDQYKGKPDFTFDNLISLININNETSVE